jgi:uncharacterized protein YyaL (SSP411 family)
MFKALIILFLSLGSIMATQLHNETSPYLLQHKDNPVDWYPWGEEAFEKAKKENKLIFLSIGYSTCHWCHVMAHESFEDEEVAKVLNKDFVSIKMDREQFPHIDGFYQKVYRLMNKRSGGWPLTIVMTPQKEPFFSATYVPKYAGYGSRGLIEVLKEIANYDRDALKEQGKKILQVVKNQEHFAFSNAKYDNKILHTIVDQLKKTYDEEYKGFGEHPKFPQFANLILLLKVYQINKDQEALTMAIETLKAMAKGGIFDQIEGAFYRYSVDQKWQVPHFEKMLYTNAEALEAYSLAYKITKEPLFKAVIDKTINQIDIRFKQKGVYKSASNADSKNDFGDNEEGYYFVYDYKQTLDFLEQNSINKKEAKNSLYYLGIKENGNFDGKRSNPEILEDTKPENLNKVIALLKQIRDKREYPFIDNKINTAWNALYLKGKLIASTIDKTYLQETLDSLDALIYLMYNQGELYHQTILGKSPTQKGILEDYSFMIDTLFEAYQITLDERYFALYEQLIKKSIELFYKDGRWIESNDGFETFADIEDYGYASSLGVHFNNLILYATMQGDTKIFEIAQKSMQYYVEHINKYPSYFPNTTLASIYYMIEPVFIKSNKENLQKFTSKDFEYPFVYKKTYKSDDYLACKINSCFSYSKVLDSIIRDINDL